MLAFEQEAFLLEHPDDPQAWDALHTFYRKRLLGMIHRRGGGAYAEDILQNTLVCFFRAVKRGVVHPPIEPLLVTITRNECVRMLQGAGRQPTPIAPDGYAAQVQLKQEDGSSAMLLMQDLNRFTKAYLQRHADDPARARRVLLCFQLCALHDQSPGDVARLFQVPVNTVHTWLHRTRRELAAWMESGE